jgi:hypothetical protein
MADPVGGGLGIPGPALATGVRLRERETSDLVGSKAQLPPCLKTDGFGHGEDAHQG